MKQVFFNSSLIAEIHEVDIPPCGHNEVLISVRSSLISTGTETQGYGSGSMISRGIRNPSAIKTVVNSLRQDGITATHRKIKAKSKKLTPRGYSGAGIIVSVGKNVRIFSVGDRVAYAGAPHAEYVAVKENMAARIPEGVSFSDAAFGAVACIALHGVRLGEPTLGENCVVLGLGLVGLLVAQFARASGLKVLGLEPNRRRRDIAKDLGFSQVIDPGAEENLVQTMHFYTNGLGTDIMYLCAGTKDSTITNDALACCRDKGRVIMIGDMGLNLDRAPLFQKELDFKVSRSYGPGRYDKNYEEKGLDYPVGYVRWTEQRNLSLFLEMIQRGEVVVDKMVSAEFPVENAPEAYRSLVENGERTLAVLLSYPEHKPEPYALPSVPRISLQKIKKKELQIGVIGCGSFVQANLLPHFRSLGARLYGVANRTPKDFSALKAIYSPDVLTTSVDQLINDPNVDAFIIATQHDSHARLAKAVLEKGKPVHVEKPLALTLADAEILARLVREKEVILTIGFNRRLAPCTKALRKALSQSPAPRQFLYRINAPVIPPDHWTLDPELGGGRLIGEGCHFIDMICYLANSKIAKVEGNFLGSGSPLSFSKDNFSIIMSFENGDLGTVVYSGQGYAEYGKERLEVYTGGRVFVVDDFNSFRGYGISIPPLELKRTDKGFKAHLGNFFSAVRGEAELVTTVDDWVYVAMIIDRVDTSEAFIK